MKRILAILLFLAAFPSSAFAACSPPADYRDCQSSPFGTNGVALMDGQYNPIETDFAKLRELANQSNSVAQSQRIQATIILTDGTIADRERTMTIFRNAEKYGIDMTIRTWGNDVETPVASKMGADLSATVALYQKETGNTIRVELGNEPNLETNGTNYARAFAAFAQNCTSCNLYLPSMGGTSLADKEQFIRDFSSNATALSLAQKADGIVFNSYADDPREALSDWTKTVAFWEGVGINTANMRYFLTEVGPSIPEPDRPGVDQFLADVAGEYAKIKANPNDPLYKYFQKLDGLTYFIWDKNQRLYLYFVNEKGVTKKNISIPSANVPGKIPLDGMPNQEAARTSRTFRPQGEEFTEMCPREEVPGEYGTAPTYRTFDSKLRPEMRNDAGLNYKSGVLGAFCGTAKGTPLLLREEAPFTLKGEPQCKVVGWAGEIQMNYDNPGGIGTPIPFAQEIADQLEGDWSAPFVSEAYMNKLENLAYQTAGQPETSLAQGKAISEIQRREGILKKVLSMQQQDQMKCDLVEYVEIKGGRSVYSGFSIEGYPMSGIPCPPNVKNPDSYTPEERAAWEKSWGTKWKRMPLVPNEYAIGEWRFIVCDDRVYYNRGGVPEVMRMGLSANALWKALTPYSEQERFFSAGYEAMRDPLKSRELLGFTARRPVRPRQPPLPPVPYLANKTMDQLAKGSDRDAQCLVKKDETPRPDRDNGRCIHFVPTGQYDDNTLNGNVARMKELGMTWTLALYDDENVLKRAAKAFGEAGIMPVWRKNLRADQAPSGYPWDRDIEIMKQYGNGDVKKYGPMIQLYNEPGDDREWGDGVPKFNVYLNNFNSMSKRIMAAGGRVGIQLQDPSELVALIDKIQSDSSINQKDYWSKIFFVPHLYASGHTPDWTKDEIGVLGFRAFAEVFQKEIGFVPPMIVGEGGFELKEHPNDNPKVTREDHAKYTAEVYNWFEKGKVSDGRPLPDYLMAFCNWIIEAAGDLRFRNYAWYDHLTGGNLDATINAVKTLPNAERKFSCDGQSATPASFERGGLSKLQESVLSKIRKVFAQEGMETGCGGLPVDLAVEVVDENPNNFVYALRVTRNACSPPGILGDIYINPPKNYELANPGKTGPHVVSIINEGLYFLNTYGGADGFMPPVRSVEELKQYTWKIDCKSFPEGHRCADVMLRFEGVFAPPAGGPGFSSSCDPTIACCETKTCGYSCYICNRTQLGPSDTGGNFGDRYGAGHILLGVDHVPSTGSYKYNPVKLIWKVPAWRPGQRPLPEGCNIQAGPVKEAPSCQGAEGDGGCAGAGWDACDESAGRCGKISCMKVHDRVVDPYYSVPFLDSTWKQLAGKSTSAMSSGVYNLFKSPQLTGTSTKAPDIGCTDNIEMVLDVKGNFVPNPGASEVGYGFDQGIGVGLGRGDDFNNFGKGEVRVYKVLPEEGKKAKVNYYRLGGLCNATMWLSRQMMTPFGFRNPAAMAAAGPGSFTPGGTPGGSGTPAGFSPGGFGSLSGGGGVPSATSPASGSAGSSSAASVTTLLPDAPKETPRVYVVTNTLVLSRLPDFGAVAVDDHILVYEQSKRIVLYRPKTNSIISQPSPITLSLRNASGVGGLGSAGLADLRSYVPHVFVADQQDARTSAEIMGTVAIPVGGNGATFAPVFAQVFGWSQLGTLPQGEPAPSADLLILVGKPRIALRNGTPDASALSAMEGNIKRVLPGAVIPEKGTAQDTKRIQSIVADTTGTRLRQTDVIAAALGITTGALPAGEIRPSAEFLILVGTDRK